MKTSKKFTPAELISKVDAMSVQQFIANISMESHKIPDDTEEAEQKRLENIADALIARFESKKLERQLAEQQSVLKEAEAKGEDISTHLKKFQDLQKQSKTRQSS